MKDSAHKSLDELLLYVRAILKGILRIQFGSLDVADDSERTLGENVPDRFTDAARTLSANPDARLLPVSAYIPKDTGISRANVHTTSLARDTTSAYPEHLNAVVRVVQ